MSGQYSGCYSRVKDFIWMSLGVADTSEGEHLCIASYDSLWVDTVATINITSVE